jgi:tRNA(Ile)-lysidine synthase
VVKDRLIMTKTPSFTALELQVLRTIRRYAMLRRGDHVLVAASGGADSMALLHCLHDMAARLDLTLTVAHFNHGIRGTESDEDAAFVRAASATLGWAFVCECTDIKAGAAAAKKNLEEAAREARYVFLFRAAESAGANRIATGHNLNDQAETILLRLLRGSGPGGLEGIHPVIANKLIRPLIECSRARILDFLTRRGATFREDSSNRDIRFQRNRIRHELIPYLEEHFNPRLAETLVREASLAHAAYDFLEEHALPQFEKMRTQAADGIALPASALAGLHPALRHQVARHAVREVLGSLRGIGTIHIEDILKLCAPGQSGHRIELPRGLGARRDLDKLELYRNARQSEDFFHYPLAWPGQCMVPEAGLELTAAVEETGAAARTPSADVFASARFNPDALPPVLAIRSRLPGDRYGGPNHRKVKKMLLAARIPLPERAGLPMVAAGDIVIWIPGFKPAKTYRADSGSSRSVLMEVRRAG